MTGRRRGPNLASVTMRSMSNPPPRFWPCVLAAGGVACAGQALLRWWLGLDLHTFFAGVLLVTLLIPPLGAITRDELDRLLLAISVTIGLALAWLLPPMRIAVSASMELHSAIIVLAWVVALVGLTSGLSALLRVPVLGSATTTLLGLAWLTAPIWLGTHAAAIVGVHPLFTLNTVLIDLGFWTEQPMEYRYLFALGQDVPYVLPTTIWPCVITHGGIGIVFCVLCFVFRQNNTYKTANAVA